MAQLRRENSCMDIAKIIPLTMKKFFFILFAVLFVANSYAQKKPLLIEKAQIDAEARKELANTLADPESKLKKFIIKNTIKGEFIFDITIEEKGKVVTVFAVSSDADNIKMQNMLKDQLKLLTFNFKMPRDKSYKFQYIFNL